MNSDLIKEIEALHGVESALLDGEGRRLHLVLSPDHSDRGSPIEMETRSLLARHFGPERKDHPTLVVSYLAEAESRRRVRLAEASLSHVDVRTVRASVKLEWLGTEVTGTAEGSPSVSASVRLAGEATLRAVETMVDDRIRFRLVGVKTVQAFDHELVVALVLPRVGEANRLPGVSLVSRGEDRARGAVRSVLNATNRILGNYLTVD